MYTALKELGYKPYHFVEAPKKKEQKHFLCWHEAFTAKLYGKGKAYGAKEFEKLLQNYSAVTNAPCVNFSDELIAAYPLAKVILSERDTEVWVESMERSYYKILSWKIWPILTYINPNGLGMVYNVLRLILFDLTAGEWQDRSALRKGYEAHNAHVWFLSSEGNLLEFRVQDGWEPLCKFLDKPVPQIPFPHANKGASSGTIVKVAIAVKLMKMAIKPVLMVLLAWALWQYGWRV
ncbi:hypothetical protein MMC25_003918 [Agyrium rufum]|nr:hypothetical protein [Agyrium rufum]